MQFLTVALLCINIVVAALLIGAVLLQKSEGGALGMGGGPSNFMSARGTGDLLTRITWILFAVFLTISITLTLIGAASRKEVPGAGLKIDPNSIKTAPADLLTPRSQAPTTSDSLAPGITVPAQAPSDPLLPGSAPVAPPEKK
ncbi:MAG: preprotein translocase, SecG subunit [Caulobacter sp.]|nr:preprotein translocase, SecG subunit [Caulobacter sp.]